MAFDMKKSLNSFVKATKKSFKGGKNSKNDRLYMIGGGVLGVIVVFLIVMAVGIYKYSWDDEFTQGVSKVVPYPIAMDNGHFITYNQYLENLNIMKKYQVEFKKVDFNSNDGKKVLIAIRRDTLDRLEEDVLVQDEAKKLNVVLTSKEVDDSYNDLIKSNGGQTAFGDVLKKYYGLSINDFKTEIYESRLLRQKVSDKFANDETVNADSKKKAQEVLDKVKVGGDFATLAKQYSQDSTASNGGDLGFFGKGKMVPEFEQAAFALKAGEVSGLVKTVYGYHIIKVTEIKGDQIRVSHILIKTKDFAAWLDESKKAAKINEYVKVPKS